VIGHEQQQQITPRLYVLPSTRSDRCWQWSQRRPLLDSLACRAAMGVDKNTGANGMIHHTP
jgi:hypothetical protein